LTFETRSLLNVEEDASDGTAATRIHFSGTPGICPLWTPLLSLHLAEVVKGDSLACLGVVTISSKKFRQRIASEKPRLEPEYSEPLSAFVRVCLMLDHNPPASGPIYFARPFGRLVGVGAGENVSDKDSRRPYLQATRTGIIVADDSAPVLTLWAAATSNSAAPGNPFSPHYLEACAEHVHDMDAGNEYAILQCTVWK